MLGLHIRVNPRDLRHLDFIGEGGQPAFWFPFLGVGSPDVSIQVATTDAHDESGTPRYCHLVNHGAVRAADGVGERKDCVLCGSETEAVRIQTYAPSIADLLSVHKGRWWIPTVKYIRTSHVKRPQQIAIRNVQSQCLTNHTVEIWECHERIMGELATILGSNDLSSQFFLRDGVP